MDTPDPRPSPQGEVREIGGRSYAVAEVRPLDVTGVRTVTVGTVLFLLAALVLLPYRGWLEENDRDWWFWTCVVGFGLGLFGSWYCRRRARRHHAIG